jgi:uncharacterized membrane protein YgcG
MQTRFVTTIFTLMLMPSGLLLFAQDQAPPAQQAQPAPQQAAFTPEQLDSIVAPIALYPDSLLSQVLVASTYPLEIVEANQWLQQNGTLQGAALVQAAQQQNWDPSIQALVPFQDVIKRLASDIRWTTDLGNAFLAQQADVMTAVQRMRARARDNGRLTDTPQQRVVVENQDGQSAIEIQPADPQVVYVPTYNPAYFWGAPPPYYPWPPLYYPAVGFGWGWGFGIHVGFFFGGCCGWGGWGWGPGWFNHSVIVNNYFFHRYNFHEYGGYGGGFRGTSAWVHDPGHRLGVPYANHAVAQRFGGANFRGGNVAGQGFRGSAAGQGFRGGAGQYAGQGFRGGNSAARPGNELRGTQQSVAPRGGQGFSAPRGAAPAQGRSFAPAGNSHSAFGGVQNGSRARVQSDHGFASMGPQRTAPAFRGGGGGGGGHPAAGGGHAGGGGSHGGGGHRR